MSSTEQTDPSIAVPFEWTGDLAGAEAESRRQVPGPAALGAASESRRPECEQTQEWPEPDSEIEVPDEQTDDPGRPAEADEKPQAPGPAALGTVPAEKQPRRERPGPGSELASYRISSGERLLTCAIGKRGLEILDMAADLRGPTYRVEQALDDKEALWAVVDDYLAQAKRLDAPPMSGEALASVMLRRAD